jgi:phage/plasmid-like protein (TIGR03299 family)
MSHDIEQFDDYAAFVSLRQPAWHGLGTIIDEPVSTARMLELASLDNWNVRLVDIRDYITDIEFAATTPYLTVRDNPFVNGQQDALGVVGERYNTYQNEELFDFGDVMLDNGGEWETAGSIKQGRVVFGTLAVPAGDFYLDPEGRNDKVALYLLVTTSHDGSVAITAAITPTRVVCANTWTAALSSAQRTYKFRHTQTAQGRIAEGRIALGLSVAYMDEFSVIANDLVQTDVDSKRFWDIIEAVYPAPTNDDPKSETRYTNKIDQVIDIYNGPTNTNIVGTAWGVANALTERLDWGRTVRGGNVEGRLISAAGLDPVSNSEKSRILTTVRQVVGV